MTISEFVQSFIEIQVRTIKRMMPDRELTVWKTAQLFLFEDIQYLAYHFTDFHISIMLYEDILYS